MVFSHYIETITVLKIFFFSNTKIYFLATNNRNSHSRITDCTQAFESVLKESKFEPILLHLAQYTNFDLSEHFGSYMGYSIKLNKLNTKYPVNNMCSSVVSFSKKIQKICISKIFTNCKGI